ncbi:MAG: PEP-CTERM sorting domain-containing protein [Pseudomonadota bacterium]|nr:PEP-CTERM sorting domain-containing protein [Pseudomonadota bacterium]
MPEPTTLALLTIGFGFGRLSRTPSRSSTRSAGYCRISWLDVIPAFAGMAIHLPYFRPL